MGNVDVGVYQVGNPDVGVYQSAASSAVLVSGIASAEAFGTLKLILSISPTGIASAEAFGAPGIGRVLSPMGIASAEAFGTPKLNPAIAPTGIPTAEAFGTPVVAGPISPSSIASAEAFGTPNVIGNRALVPSSIASQEAFGNPVVAGPIIAIGIPTGTAFGVPVVAGPIAPPGIASAEAFGTPFLNQQQKIIDAGAIASQEAFGTPYVANVLSILPSGIASAEAFGVPIVKGSEQFIVAAGGIAPGEMGIPKIIGGVKAIELYIGGVNRSRFLAWETARVSSQTIGRWTASCDLKDSRGVFAPALGQTMRVADYGFPLFAGCIIERKIVREISTEKGLTITIQATDKSALCDRRRVFSDYTADQDGADVVRDAAANYLNGEGITLQGVPTELGLLGVDIPANLWTVTELFDRIGDLTGTVWWVDVYGVLQFSTLANLPAAPISITETSKNYRFHSAITSLRDYRNTQWVRTNRNIVPEDPAEGGQGSTSVTESFTLPYQPSVDRGFLFGAVITQQPILQITSLKVNGVAKTYFTLTGASYGQAPADLSELWWVIGGAIYVTPPTSGPQAALSPGDVVEISYIPWIQTVAVEAGDALVPATIPGLPGLDGSFGTCGSGKIEAVEQVNDIFTREGLRAMAQAILSKLGEPPNSIEIETDEPGLAVGQRLPVDLPFLYLPSTELLITGLSGRSMGVDLGRGSTFRWNVQATNIADPGNTVKWFERLVRRQTHPLPLDRFEEAIFIIAPGGSLSAGIVSTNKPIVSNTGQLFEAVAVATDAPVDQDALIDVRIGGVSIFGNAPLVIPAGATTLQRTVQFATPVAFVYRNNVFDLPQISYRVTGPNPQPAASITMKVRWKY